MGYQDEPVDLQSIGIKQLYPGSVMVYEANYDVHEQFAPETLSVSLNLMCRNAAINETPQYVFDVEGGRLAGGAGDMVGNRLFMIKLLEKMGDANSVEILGDLVHKHACKRTKAMALTVLETLSPDQYACAAAFASPEVRELSTLPIIYGNDTRFLTGKTVRERSAA